MGNVVGVGKFSSRVICMILYGFSVFEYSDVFEFSLNIWNGKMFEYTKKSKYYAYVKHLNACSPIEGKVLFPFATYKLGTHSHGFVGHKSFLGLCSCFPLGTWRGAGEWRKVIKYIANMV